LSDLEANTIRLDLPATYQHLSILSAVIHDLLSHVATVQQRESLIYSVQLAAHEVCANVIDHAYHGMLGKRLTITLSLDLRQIVVEICDTAPAFDISNVRLPDLETPQECGYGLVLIHHLVDEVTYASEETGNRCRLVKYF
jgi:serine/threonine-protein kinase RsbW